MVRPKIAVAKILADLNWQFSKRTPYDVYMGVYILRI